MFLCSFRLESSSFAHIFLGIANTKFMDQKSKYQEKQKEEVRKLILKILITNRPDLKLKYSFNFFFFRKKKNKKK